MDISREKEPPGSIEPVVFADVPTEALDTEPMTRDDEARALVAVINHLTERFPDIPPSVIENVVAEEHSSLGSGRIREYVSVLVEHAAKNRLTKVAADIRLSGGFSSELVGKQPSAGKS